jgi:peroxiredoxin
MDTMTKEKSIAKKEELKMEELVSQTTENILLDLIKAAVEKGDTNTLKYLIELKKQIQKEIAKNEFYKALHGFQSELQPIKRSNVVYNKDGSIRYKYASFDDIVKAIQPLLKKFGLTFHFKAEYDKENQIIIVHCIITHILGHQEIATFKAPLALSDRMQFMQAYGSILTYAKRYSLSLALGLATEEDENLSEEEQLQPAAPVDKTTSTEPKILKPTTSLPKIENIQPEEITKTPEEKPEPKPTEPKITENQKRYIINLLNQNNLKMEELYHYILSTHGKIITSIDDLTKTEASKIIDALKNWTVEKKTTPNETVIEEEDIPF